ncbi:hypothetical protein Dimus_034416 [Dionaea muscipula]
MATLYAPEPRLLSTTPSGKYDTVLLLTKPKRHRATICPAAAEHKSTEENSHPMDDRFAQLVTPPPPADICNLRTRSPEL